MLNVAHDIRNAVRSLRFDRSAAVFSIAIYWFAQRVSLPPERAREYARATSDEGLDDEQMSQDVGSERQTAARH